MIERATLDDIADLVDCWERLVQSQQQYGTILDDRNNRENCTVWYGELVIRDRIRVARIDDAIVGFVSFMIEPDRFSRLETVGRVHNLYVETGFREQGIGSSLLDVAESELLDRGADSICLDTLATNRDAAEFYRSRGYGLHRKTLKKSLGETDKHYSID